MNAALASWAVRDDNSRGRRVFEAAPEGRGQFQRDRDRIVHSTAFRRLEYKTQVFVNHEGDLFRTRLTHSLEVAQIARSIARILGVNEDLSEAIAYAHDLGHTPFGHAGQDALNACMKEYGGFEHNLQSLRIVDQLEEHYADFNGLNLCWETREGILKHCSTGNAGKLGDLGRRFLEHTQPSLEAQLNNYADEIAYNNHDLDDGLRAGFITLEQLEEVELVAAPLRQVRALYPGLSERRLIHETVRRLINTQARDLVETTFAAIRAAGVETLDDVRAAPRLVGFSPAMDEALQPLRAFLRRELYQHYRVQREMNKARRIIRELFDAFLADPRLLLPKDQIRAKEDAPRTIADYIAGMTDRYAVKEHRRLFAIDEA